MDNFKKLKAERTQLRRFFTVSAGMVDIALEEGKKEQIFVKFATLADKAERLFKIDAEMNSLIFEAIEDEKELEAELNKVEEYRERWVALLAKRDYLIDVVPKQTDNDSVRSDTTGNTVKQLKKTYKLPKLELRRFDGTVPSWLVFWAFFKKIDADQSIDEDDKFNYLIQSMAEGSPAHELVCSFPPTADNYPKAIGALKQRFGRDELLIEFYIRGILSLVLQTSSGKDIELRLLYDKLETQLRSLESLGVTSDKYASMLLPLAESALPDAILRLWERCRPTDETAKDYADQLKALLKFLRKEVESDKRISLARETFAKLEVQDSSSAGGATGGILSSEPPLIRPTPTATDLVNVEQRRKTGSCVFCSKVSHDNSECYKAMDMTPQEIEVILKRKGLCFTCMRGNHKKQDCKVGAKCVICRGRHVALLCSERKIPETPKPTPMTPSATDTVEHMLSNVCLPNVLMQTLEVIVRGETEFRARLLIDTGSQRSYMTKRTVSKLGYKTGGQEQLIHGLFGGAKSSPTPHNRYKVRLMSVNRTYACNFDALDAETICQAVPVAARGPWLQELEAEGIKLSDTNDGPIDILVGADIAGKLWTGKIKVLSCGLVAVETLLGWTLMGKVEKTISANTCDTYISLFCAESRPEELWNLEILGIEDPAQSATKSEKLHRAWDYFNKTVQILPDGRYQVHLPWLCDHPTLQRNFVLALSRFEKENERLKRKGTERAYFEVLNEWLQEGVIEEVPREDWDRGHYLPHRAVYKEGSTTPIRPVFDASAREKGHPSLNQCVEAGPALLAQVPALLIRFRKGRLGIVADIRRAFLQIAHDPIDRDFLRFIWRDNDGGLRIFRHARVVFGVRSSPFLLGAVLEHHLRNSKVKVENGDLDCPVQIIDQLQNSLYVDNFVGSLQNEQDVAPFIKHARSLLALAQFDLRGWEHTDENLEDHRETSVLGLIWDQKDDTLKIRLPDFSDINPSRVTKRNLSSTFQRIYDPLGLTSPVSVIPKRLLQIAWSRGGGWEDTIDEESRAELLKWISDVPELAAISVPRWLKNFDCKEAVATLHVFCDASQVAYASVIFLRVELHGDIGVQLVASKSRIAPTENVSIPRLELLAATIGARLGHKFLEYLGNVSDIYYWTDSSTVLTWIQKEEPWAVFVGNRVAEIRKLTNKRSWRHIPGTLNPADLASRGCSPKTLIQQQWWLGPKWLALPEGQWPSSSFEICEEEVLAEKRRVVVSNVTQTSPVMDSGSLTRRFTSYTKIVNVLGWVLRFLFNKFSKRVSYDGPLSLVEIERAERVLLRVVQDEAFEGVSDKMLGKLKPRVDVHGLIRLRTKLWARKDTELFREPYILPSRHILVERLILQTHLDNGHVIGQTLLNLLRERYWILKGRQTVKRVVSTCISCKRAAAKPLDAETPPLPEHRVRDARVFEVCGTDFAGPLYLRNGDKVWVCIFTCAVYRAVYLDTVTSLSTEAFTMAFRRFVARHGRPSIVYSDNGTNYRGLNNALCDIDWDKIKGMSAVKRIDWRFNPPTASWWGGFWERLIGVVKTLLRKILGRASLTMEELTTVVLECASYVNARPITYVSEDNDDPVAISPSMLIGDIPEIGMPDIDAIDAGSLERRVKQRMETMKNLRERFRSEYLGELSLASKKLGNCRTPKVGELVLVGSDNKKRLDWPLAVIESVIGGTDGTCRVVKLRTADGILTRPIQRVYPLEIQLFDDAVDDASGSRRDEDHFEIVDSSASDGDIGVIIPDQVDVPAVQEVTTRCGRKVTLPLKYMS